MNNIKKKGGHIGKAPYGYKIKKINNVPKLILNNLEAETIELIKNYYLILKDFKMVAEKLNNLKILKRNINWNKISIKNILKKYCKNCDKIQTRSKSKININESIESIN